MKNYSRQLLIIFLSSLALFPVLVQADLIKLDNPLKAGSFQDLIDALIKIIFDLALAVAPIMIIVAGFYFVTAAGNPAQITTAKQIILWTLIGLLIVISARGIIVLFQQVFPTSNLTP